MIGNNQGIEFDAFSPGLPPSCKIETTTEEVQELLPTGKTVSKTIRKIVCV
jgi:hypothetical protein